MKNAVPILVFILMAGLTNPAHAENHALSFDGANDYVIVPDSDPLDVSTGMTIEAWIRSFDTGGARIIASKWTNGTGDFSYIFKDHDASDKLRITFSSGGCDDLADLEGTTSIPTGGEWVHAAATYDSNYVRLFFNGVEDSSMPASGIIHDSAMDLLIGAVNVYKNDSQDFKGLIDEVRIWNYARTQQQLQDWMHYSLYGNEPNLAGYWNFDEGDGQIAHDLTIYANHGQLGSVSGMDDNDPLWISSNSPVAPVPEPASLLLFGIGGLAAALINTRKARMTHLRSRPGSPACSRS